MRVLFATTAGAGHLGPLIPFARASVEAGHDVVVAAADSFGPTVEATGFTFRAVGERSQEENEALFARVRTAPFDEANRLVVEDGYGRLYARAALPAMLRLTDELAPDVIVRETAEFSSLVAAARSEIPCVQVSTGLQDTLEPYRVGLTQALRELASEAGTSPASVEKAMTGEAIFTLTPPSMEQEAYRGQIRAFRASAPLTPAERPGGRPLIYLTFGTEAAHQGFFPGLYRAAIDGLAGGPWDVLVSIGRGIDPSALGPLPPAVQVEPWVDQADVLRRVAAVVCHGGYGTLIGALAAGVPLVVLPLFAVDQVANGQRISELGAGLLLAGPQDVGRVGDAVQRLLGEPGFAAGAVNIAAEIALLPPVAEAVDVLAALRRG